MNWFLEKRLDYIKERLSKRGYINRQDIMDKFSVSMPTASHSLREYVKRNPDSIKYNYKAKRYERVN